MSVPRILGLGPESPGMLPRCWVSRYHNTAKHTHGACLPGVAPTVTVGLTVKILRCYLVISGVAPSTASCLHFPFSEAPASVCPSFLFRPDQSLSQPGEWSLRLSSLTH